MHLPSLRAGHRQAAEQILGDSRIILAVWLTVGLATPLLHLYEGHNNNYLMFHYSFTHLIDQQNLSEVPFLIAGGILLLLPYLRTACYRDPHFRFLALACALMFVVLFSTSAENPTYIVLQSGVAAWFCAGSRLPLRPRAALLLAVLLFSSLTPTDLLPGALGDFYAAHSLRVLPCVMVWLVAICEMLRGRISPEAKPQVATAWRLPPIPPRLLSYLGSDPAQPSPSPSGPPVTNDSAQLSLRGGDDSIDLS